MLFVCGVLISVGRLFGGASFAFSGPPTLKVRTEAERVVLELSGPVEAPMQQKLAEALERFEDDPRRLVLSLNSPGGQVQHGHQVIKTIRKASYKRPIDTLVEAGKSCASMCVPIYLVGAERSAHPNAKFMFHEVRFQPTPETSAALNNRDFHRQAVNHFTNELFDEDLGPRAINKRWLERVRGKIRGRDAWFTAQQLVKEDSGVVFTLTQK